MAEKKHYTVAVITSTVGRNELERAIQSVQNQTYPAKHYVFVDGKNFWQAAENILQHYPDVIPFYLPINTGRNGWYNSRINAAAPFFIEEDIICLLDDDNFYQPEHIESIVATFQQDESLDWVYALRNIVDDKGNFVCQDTMGSLGFYERSLPYTFSTVLNIEGYPAIEFNINENPKKFVDVNCYAFTKNLACLLGPSWNQQGYFNDRNVFQNLALEEGKQFKSRCTDRFSVNYFIDPNHYCSPADNQFLEAFIPDAEARKRFIYAAIKQLNESCQIIKT